MAVSSTTGGLKTGVCLSTDRPDNPFDGQVIYETDTNRTLVYDNSAWVVIHDPTLMSYSGTGVTVTADAATIGGENVTPYTGRRNLLYNGAMQVAQRGTSVTGVTTTGYYTLDRWAVSINSAGTWTVTQESDGPDGFANSLKVECTSTHTPTAGDYLNIRQSLEGLDVQALKKGTTEAVPLTLSFWVKSNKTGTYVVELRDLDNTRYASKAYAVNSAGVWEYKTITFPPDTTGTIDNDTGNSFGVDFWLYAGTNFTSGTLQTGWQALHENRAVGQLDLGDTVSNYWQITGVQLELGDKATPFEHRSFGEELRLCQRYFEKSFDYGTAPAHNTGGLRVHNNCGSLGCGGNTYGRLEFAVSKRASPTMRIYDPTASHPATENWWRSYSGCSSGTAVTTGFAWTFYENIGVGYCQYSTGAAFSFEWTAEAEL